MSRSDKLTRLAQIAALKATLAKGDAARILAEADALSQRIDTEQDARRERAGQMPEPAIAHAHAAWLRQCDQTLRSLRSEQAQIRVRLDVELERARYEEGRRQILETLKGQAS